MLMNIALVVGFEQVLSNRARGNGKIWFNKFYCSFHSFSYVSFKTSTYTRQKSRSIYSKFSLEWSEVIPNFQNPQKVA